MLMMIIINGRRRAHRRHVFNHESEPGPELLGVWGWSGGVIKLKADRVKTLQFDPSPPSRVEVKAPTDPSGDSWAKNGRVTKVNK